MASEAEKTENGGEDAGAKVHLRESRNPATCRGRRFLEWLELFDLAMTIRMDPRTSTRKGTSSLNMGEELQNVYLETSRPMNRGAVRLRQLSKNCKFTDIDKERYCSSS
jgi:hypothetical protein